MTVYADGVTLDTGNGETCYQFVRENIVVMEIKLRHAPTFLTAHNQIMAWYNRDG